MTKKISKESWGQGWRIGTGFLLVGFLIFGLSHQACSEVQMAKATFDLAQGTSDSDSTLSSDMDVSIKENQIIELNKNLKNAIEENQHLTDTNKKILDEMNQLKSDHMEGSSRYQELKQERDGLADTIEQVRGSNRRYSQQIKKMEEEVKQLEGANAKVEEEKEALVQNLEEINTETVAESEAVLDQQSEPGEADEGVTNRESKTLDILSRIDAFTEQDARLRMDSAKAHYNMGNIYFQKGQYDIATREYYQAVMLMPDDPDAHYNLAFVSAEHLKDDKTALKHYQMYLYLNPDAKDAYSVKEKIIGAQLRLKNTINSPIDDLENK